MLQAEDGTSVYGRTMEWGAFDLHSRIVIVPRELELSARMPDGSTGAQWKTRYGVVAVDGLKQPYALDGLNEKGLTAGVFYHPGFAAYTEFDAGKREVSLGPGEVANWILTQFATVAEVRKAIVDMRVVPVVEESLGFAPPIHLLVSDPSGEAIVIEFLNGEVVVFDAPLGVITNAPSYDWHMTNLRNYINLSAVSVPAKTLNGVEFAPLGNGTNMLSLPGDFTPPSRFVRAVAYTQTARPTADGPETIYELFRILDNFNLPVGAAEGSDATPGDDELRSSTLWTTAIDTRNLVLYYHTAHNRRVRAIDLKTINFAALRDVVFIPLDRERAQDIEMVQVGKKKKRSRRARKG